MIEDDVAWGRLLEVCDALHGRGIAAVPSRRDRSMLVLRVSPEASTDAERLWQAAHAAPEVKVSDEELLHPDYREILLRKVVSVIGHQPRA